MRKLSAFVAVIAVLVLPLEVAATHSVPYPRWFWDKDNDGVAENVDSDISYQRAGTG